MNTFYNTPFLVNTKHIQSAFTTKMYRVYISQNHKTGFYSTTKEFVLTVQVKH